MQIDPKPELKVVVEGPLLCGCEVNWEDRAVTKPMLGCVLHNYLMDREILACGCRPWYGQMRIEHFMKGCVLHEEKKV